MNKIITCFFLAASLYACKNETIIRENKYPNGKLKSKIVKKKNSENEARYFSYYESGAIESEGYVDNELLRQKEWKYFNTDGSVSAEGRYSDDLRVDEWMYKTADTAFSIYWEKYISRPISLNMPKGWMIENNVKDPILLSAANDSNNVRLGINVSRTQKGSEPIDTFVVKGNRYFKKMYPHGEPIIADAILNGRKAIKVILITQTPDGKILRSFRYYLEANEYIYLVSFFSLQHDMTKLYDKVTEEMALSFKIID